MLTEQTIDGEVEKTTVRHYRDCSSSTQIKLKDGRTVVYSHVAPIPQGHSIRAVGVQTELIRVLLEFHSGVFAGAQDIHTYLAARDLTFDLDFGRDAENTVLKCHEIKDETDGVTYREYR